MKIIQRIYLIGIMTILIGIVFHAPLSVGLGVLFPAQQEFIKSWKEIIMVVLAVLAIVAVSKRKLWHEFGRDWVFRCITAYALLHIVTTTFLWQGLGATAAGFAIDLRYLLFFGLTYTFIKLWPQYKKPALIASIAGAVVV
ncbi:MAG: hypothetical protein ABJA64_00395, partial [Candidatus Saccharibacteria bacterium]